MTFAPAAPARPMRKDPLMVTAFALIAILVVAVIVVAIIAAPISPVNFNQTLQDSHPNINKLNLNFQADTAQVNVIPMNITDKNILIIVSAVGSKGIFGSSNLIHVSFDNQTVNNELTVTSKVTDTNGLFTRNFKVTCTIYVNPTLNLNLNVTTQTGEVTLSAEKPATFQSINLQANTGDVQVTMQNVTIAGDLSLKTETGAVYYGMSQGSVQGNSTVNLQSTTGSVDMDITETKTLQGNLQVNAATTTGSINVGLQIDGDVGAKITSQATLGSINPNVQNFSGDQSPLQSNNYPAASNIEINNRTNLGSININAAYQSSVTPSIRN